MNDETKAAADSETLVWFAAQRIEQGWHDKEGA